MIINFTIFICCKIRLQVICLFVMISYDSKVHSLPKHPLEKRCILRIVGIRPNHNDPSQRDAACHSGYCRVGRIAGFGAGARRLGVLRSSGLSRHALANLRPVLGTFETCP